MHDADIDKLLAQVGHDGIRSLSANRPPAKRSDDRCLIR
jgi:hypothetical protein